MPSAQPSLGQSLLDRGLLTADQLRIALLEQEQHGRPLGQILVHLGFLDETMLRDALSATFGTRSVDLAHAVISPEALQRIPRDVALRHKLIPLAWEASQARLTVARADIHDLVALDRLRALLGDGIEIDTVLAGESDIARAIDQHYGHQLSIDDLLHDLERGRSEGSGEHGTAIVRLVDALLNDAVKRNASDIHLEPEAGFLRIRYRIDGLLRQIRVLHKRCWPAIVVRIKILAGMNIAEMRAPQDGHFSLNVSGRAIDLRVASQPTLHGENLVLRILDRQKGIVPLADLGLDAEALAQLQHMLARPEGLLLVTGPTGSGKTTTLYAIIDQLNDEGIHIMTLEDPVEYPLPRVRQTSIAEGVKLDFANGIRSMMRQDPDIILVGEIRDAETADMAFRAAMTGHQVFSTLHSRSALGAIPRLLDLGVLPDLLGGNLTGIVAQRLVRRLCPHCKTPAPPTPAERRHLNLPESGPTAPLFHPAGCPACDFQGYRGRFALMECLPIDDGLDELIAQRASRQALLRHARRRGLRTLAEDGLRRVREGTTTLAEVARVVDLSELATPCAERGAELGAGPVTPPAGGG